MQIAIHQIMLSIYKVLGMGATWTICQNLYSVSFFFVVGTCPFLDSKEPRIPSSAGRERILSSIGCLQFNPESILLLVLPWIPGSALTRFHPLSVFSPKVSRCQSLVFKEAVSFTVLISPKEPSWVTVDSDWGHVWPIQPLPCRIVFKFYFNYYTYFLLSIL